MESGRLLQSCYLQVQGRCMRLTWHHILEMFMDTAVRMIYLLFRLYYLFSSYDMKI
jgi:hypothetical protein